MINTFLHKIVSGVIGSFLVVSSLFTGGSHAPTVGSTIPVVPSLFDTILASGIGTSDSSLTLSSAALRDGTTLSGYVCFSIDEGTPVAEFTCGTVSGTSVTGLVRGIDPISGTTTVTALKFAHRRGADIKVTDYPVIGILSRILNGNDTLPNVISYGSNVAISTSSNQLVHSNYLNNNYVSLPDNQTISGNKTFTGSNTFTLEVTGTTPTVAGSLATKGYVDGVATSGAANANTATKGLVQEATGAQIVAGTATGTTGARLFINPSTLASSTAVIAGLITTSNQYASSTWPSGGVSATSTMFTITSTSSTQRMNVWVKADQLGSGQTTLWLTYATSTGYTILDKQIANPGSGTVSMSLLSSTIPTATGTVQLSIQGAQIELVQSILQLIR